MSFSAFAPDGDQRAETGFAGQDDGVPPVGCMELGDDVRDVVGDRLP
jgi:hypothetical protein